MAIELSAEEWQRYGRQLGPGGLSRAQQESLRQGAALVTRAGGMGGPAALALTMAGIGRLYLAHGGEMIVPDLNRQLLGSEAVVGKPRAVHFAEYLRSMNRHVEVVAIDHEPDDAEAVDLAAKCQVLLSCPPNFTERMRLNRAAVATGTPLVDAAQWGLTGTLIVVRPGASACLECLYPQEPPFDEAFPVVGAISMAMGSLAALEAIKLLTAVGEPAVGRMFVYDGYHGRHHTVELQRRRDCRVCGSPARAETVP